MMHVIWKYSLAAPSETYMIPAEAEVVHVGREPSMTGDHRGLTDHMGLAVWMRVDPERPEVKYEFFVQGTGHPLAEHDGFEYLGTEVVPPFAWHVLGRWVG